MIGTFEGVELTHNQFGQQYTMINGAKYVTFLGLPDQAGCETRYSVHKNLGSSSVNESDHSPVKEPTRSGA
jgi:hypothetical protein